MSLITLGMGQAQNIVTLGLGLAGIIVVESGCLILVTSNETVNFAMAANVNTEHQFSINAKTAIDDASNQPAQINLSADVNTLIALSAGACND